MAALTLVEAMKTAPNPLTAGVMARYAASSEVLRVLPFEDIQGDAKRWNREKTLPSTGFRAIGGTWTAAPGVVDPQFEPTVIAGGTLEIDRQIVKRNPASRAQHELMKVKSLAHTVGHKVIKGDAQSTNTEFDGLQVRCLGNQLIAAGSTSGGDALSLAKMDELLDNVPGATHLVMSRAMRRLITQGVRNGKDAPLTYYLDEFGRQVMQWGGLPILLTDGPDQVNSSLAFDEACPGGGSSVGTSIYAIRIALDGFHGIQNGPMEVVDLGQIAAEKYTTLVEWSCGIIAESETCIGRLYGIKNAAVVV